MDIKIACGFMIRGETETVYNYLLKCDTWPSIEEIMEATGIKNKCRVQSSISIIKQQIRLAEGRKEYFRSIQEQNQMTECEKQTRSASE